MKDFSNMFIILFLLLVLLVTAIRTCNTPSTIQHQPISLNYSVPPNALRFWKGGYTFKDDVQIGDSVYFDISDDIRSITAVFVLVEAIEL